MLVTHSRWLLSSASHLSHLGTLDLESHGPPTDLPPSPPPDSGPLELVGANHYGIHCETTFFYYFFLGRSKEARPPNIQQHQTVFSSVTRPVINSMIFSSRLVPSESVYYYPLLADPRDDSRHQDVPRFVHKANYSPDVL